MRDEPWKSVKWKVIDLEICIDFWDLDGGRGSRGE
jgi:hypothetical protein